MNKKIISIVLSLCVLFSCFAGGSFTSNAVIAEQETSSASTETQNKIQGSAILHCFDWSYNSIKSNLQDIKDAGYTAVQTSPVQPPKDYNSGWTDQSGQWWKLYQPISISIADGNTWLGTKAELKSLCDEAEKMGIKVIVDIVANHMANVSGTGNNMSDISSQVDSTLRNNADYWHINSIWASDSSRYDMTQGSIGQPDLNTGNSYIQQAYKNLLIELIGLGVDGFRFDAAKHIELPTDSDCGSQFWPTVINGSQASTSEEIFYYGEILNSCGTSISNYTEYMSITDNYSGDRALVAANSSNASGLANSSYAKGADASKSVLWAESHDTYMGDSGSAGLKSTKDVSDASIVKAWAIVGSRADSTSLYFARPASTMGSASADTTWKSTAVAEVNKFKNYFDGQTEALSSSGSIAYNERGTSGVVLVNCSGTSTSVSVKANKMKDGTYKDHITGNTFTVSGGQITGQIGSTGVAVVYNEVSSPYASVTPGSQTYDTDTLKLTLNYTNATSGQYSINGGAYQSYTNGQTITIGAGLAYGTVTTVKVKATDGTTTSQEQTYTYTKEEPGKTLKIYFDNSSYNWNTVYVYVYNLNTSESNASWPGVQMQIDSSTGYYYEVPENLENGYAIFTESSDATNNRYPADQEQGLAINSTAKIFKANHVWTDYSEPVPTTVPATTVPITTAPATTAPTTEPVTDPPVADFTVEAKSNIANTVSEIYSTKNDSKITVTYKLKSSQLLSGAQWQLTYDKAKLRLSSSNYDSNGELKVMPVADSVGNVVANLPESGRIKGNFQGSTNAYDFTNESVLVKVDFDILASGSATVNLDVQYITYFKGTAQLVTMVDDSAKTSNYNASASIVLSEPSDTPITKLPGDANLDGNVDIKDAAAIQLSLAKLASEFNEQQKLNADVNEDGEVNIKDAALVQLMLAHLINSYK